MSGDKLLTWLKAIGTVLGAAGITISPENWETITAGIFAFYGVVTAIRAHLFK
jgi:hypothetical protein